MISAPTSQTCWNEFIHFDKHTSFILYDRIKMKIFIYRQSLEIDQYQNTWSNSSCSFFVLNKVNFTYIQFDFLTFWKSHSKI